MNSAVVPALVVPQNNPQAVPFFMWTPAVRNRHVAQLVEQVESNKLEAKTGIAHTRWATHGRPEVCNAHPLFSRDFIGLVHNGIIENFESIRAGLLAKGFEFTSQTDTEVLAHLINDCYDGDLLEAVKRAGVQGKGSYGSAVRCKAEPGCVVVARQGAPLVVGGGDNEMFAASDAMAVAGITDRIVYLEEGDVCKITPAGRSIFARKGEAFVEVDRPEKVVHAYSGAVDLGPYRHYMQKEIFEQPRAIGDTLEGVASPSATLFGEQAESIINDTN